MTEHDLQASIIAECDIRANQDPRWGMLFAIPNGGHRNIRVAVKLKAEGVRAGIPDLFLPVPSRGYHGLWIELKVGRNKQTPQQAQWASNLWEMGYAYDVVYDADHAINFISWYLRGVE